MGKIRTYINSNEKKLWTLFDTGARNTYIVADKANDLLAWEIKSSEPVALGGKTHYITKECILLGNIEEFPIRVKARIIDDIGCDEENKRIEVVFGALAMQEWGIRPVPDEEKLDLSNYPREFVEF